MNSIPRSRPGEAALELARICWRAGEILLRHYASETVDVRRKPDESPVTDADEEAEAFILAELRKSFPGVPVVAEESVAAGHAPDIANRFFLVDPLDGTKEFVSRNGEFTVNIGEIVNGRPVRGCVFAPAKSRLFLGDGANGAFESAATDGAPPDFVQARPVAARRAPADGLVAVASRSHRDAQTDVFLARFPISKFVSAGSSLKFCLVATGEADLYPRLGRTMEWDTAAGDAVLTAAGGRVSTLDGRPFVYGKVEEKFANPFFVARGRD